MLDPAFCLYAVEQDDKDRLEDILKECQFNYDGQIPDEYVKEIEAICRRLSINPNSIINYDD